MSESTENNPTTSQTNITTDPQVSNVNEQLVQSIAEQVVDILREPIEKLDEAVISRLDDIKAELEQSDKPVTSTISEGLYEGFKQMDDSPIGQLAAIAVYSMSEVALQTTNLAIELATNKVQEQLISNDNSLPSETSTSPAEKPTYESNTSYAEFMESRVQPDTNASYQLTQSQEQGIER